jgi:hypothetical protein
MNENNHNETTVPHDGEYHTIRLANAKGEMVASIIIGPYNTHILTNWFKAGEFTVEDVTKEGVV